MGDGMRAEIPGEKADAQSPGALRPLGLRLLRMLLGKEPSPLANGPGDVLRSESIGVVKRHDVRGPRLQVRGIQAAGNPELFDCRVDISAPHLDQPEVVAD